jgi:glycosyltransferase involved in cell wall biosynthesis
MAEGLVARPIEGLLPIRDARGPLRVLLASLAPGGAERIVIEWLGAEAARGRQVELAVLHRRRLALPGPAGICLSVRARETPEAFLATLGTEWRADATPVSTHLVTDEHLAVLWAAGVRTVPVVHNARAGWRNDPASWEPRHVPLAVACAEHVRDEMLAAGCRVPIVVVRHRPRVGPAAIDARLRQEIRAEHGIAPGTFLVGSIGAIKPQKDHARAVEVLAQLSRRRDAALVVLGGLLESSATAELERVLDRAIALGVVRRLRLPGFVSDIEPWLAACDAVVNVSLYEGLPIALQEALAAGLPVVAADVAGSCEVRHPALEWVQAGAGAEAFAERLARLPVREALLARPFARAPRCWSLTLASRPAAGASLDTLFVTANLNAGGAQRSLANLAGAIGRRHRLAIAVCGELTHAMFANELASHGCEVFRACIATDDFAIAESILAHASARSVRNLCFWNAAPGVKLLVARFAPPGLRIVDASPGRYAFEELQAARELGDGIDFTPDDYYARLDVLVLKHADAAAPPARRVVRIPNGVALRDSPSARSEAPRYLVSGRIAPSKRLETILAAFHALRKDLPAATLEIAGTAEPRHAAYLRSLVAMAGEAVRFRGDAADLAHLAEAWTATIVLGTHQGCPNAVLEAMGAGIAVIANASGGTGELVVDGQTGWLLPEDVAASRLAATMHAAWTDAAEAHARSCAARRHVAAFSLEAMASRYMELLASPVAATAHEKMAAWIPAAASPTT